jgi:hypothetical protein
MLDLLNLFFAAALCAPLMAISAYATDYDDVSVKVEQVTEARGPSGYSEYRVRIINGSLSKAHRVRVATEGYYDAVKEIGRAVDLAPSSNATISIFRPQSASGGGGWFVTIDGQRQSLAAEVDSSRVSAWTSHPQDIAYVLSSRGVENIGLMKGAAVIKGFMNSSGEIEVGYLSYNSPISEWSGNWLAYSGFDAVALTAEELRAAPEAVRSALWRYAECGGSLLIIGAWEIPQQWRSSGVDSVAANSYFVGFGRVFVIKAADIMRDSDSEWKMIKLGFKDSRLSVKTYYDIANINNEFPVVEKIGIPVRGLFVLMLAFVVVIGPINLIWLARRRKKIWMLWTVPVISIVACLAVTGFALLGEGMSATSRTEAFTILDESSHHATTIGWTAFYAPITPGDGLHFSYDAELAPALPESSRYGGGVTDRTIDFSNDQHLDSGWIAARVPAYFKFRKSETRRERLTIRIQGGDSISVVNGLGADIRALWLAGGDGKVYSARGIQAGAEAKLSPANLALIENKDGLRELFATEDWTKKMDEVVAIPQKFLAPGCYLAELDASPFVEEGLKGVKLRKVHTLVYGVGAPVAQNGQNTPNQ